MTIPGFDPHPGIWQSTVPGWARPERTGPIATSAIVVSLAGITVESNPASSTDYRAIETLDGWWDGVDSRSDNLAKPGRDGEHEGQVLLGGRPVQASGVIVTPDRKILLEELERFGSVLMGTPRFADLVVTEKERGLSRQCRVRMVQPATVTPLSDRVAEWAWFLRAADPIRYDADAKFVDLKVGGPDQSVENIGNTPVALTLTLKGPIVTPSLWIDGAQWKLNRTLAANETVTAYWQEREVWSGSTSLRYYQSGPWPLLRQGITRVGLSAVSGNGTARVSWRSGWL